MEELFEFLFGASGRINRAKYWRSLLIFCGAGLLVGVILLTAAGLVAPPFIPMLVVVFIPSLAGFAVSIWGFVEIGCLRGNAGPNKYGSNPLQCLPPEADYSAAKAVAQLKS